MSVNDLKSKRIGLLNRMDDLVGKAIKANREMTAAEQDEWATLNSQVKSLDNIITSREGAAGALNEARVSRGVPAIPGTDFRRAVMFLSDAKGQPGSAAEIARKAGHEGVAKALSTVSGATGGYLIGPELQRDFIGLLRPANVFLSAQPRIVDASKSVEIDFSRVTAGGAASYLNEVTDPLISVPSFGKVSLRLRRLAAAFPFSNDLARYSDLAEQLLGDEIVAAVSQLFDQKMLRGDGIGKTPLGLRYAVKASQTHTMTATPDATKVLADLTTLETDLDNANVLAARRVAFMNPRVFKFLRNLTNAGGQYVFPELRAQTPRLLSFNAVFPTTQIPVNLGAGNESEVLVAEMSQVVFADGPMQVKLSSVGGYVDENGLVAAFHKDQSTLLIHWQHDVALRVPEAVSVLTGVTWGA